MCAGRKASPPMVARDGVACIERPPTCSKRACAFACDKTKRTLRPPQCPSVRERRIVRAWCATWKSEWKHWSRGRGVESRRRLRSGLLSVTALRRKTKRERRESRNCVRPPKCCSRIQLIRPMALEAMICSMATRDDRQPAHVFCHVLARLRGLGLLFSDGGRSLRVRRMCFLSVVFQRRDCDSVDRSLGRSMFALLFFSCAVDCAWVPSLDLRRDQST